MDIINAKEFEKNPMLKQIPNPDSDLKNILILKLWFI